ncbi:hypothetical protein [Clostridium estertheticum]|uniref:hypothetical protein n=1 Tax=Clostridium estertheticum TaxID=238834 RepID=UPI001CF1533E|nr:hypothetical protein [Clostridium estertheticum]MCB2353006.1 hypothetical protein [Clostridium estertheticum]WAG40306.1 hypothetical protein LL065_18830 [Clostridium estertheticum]
MFRKVKELEKYIFLLEILWVDCDFERLEFQSFCKLNVSKAVITMEAFHGEKAKKLFT